MRFLVGDQFRPDEIRLVTKGQLQERSQPSQLEQFCGAVVTLVEVFFKYPAHRWISLAPYSNPEHSTSDIDSQW